MKRIAVYLTISHLAFTCGVAVSSFWNGNKGGPKNEQIHVRKQYTTAKTLSSPPPAVSTLVTPDGEVVFGEGRLRLITHQMRLKSERLRYEIDVSYPEIIGTKDPHIQKLNRHIKKLATHQYQWPLNPSKAELRYYKDKHPDVFNTVDLDYEIHLATDSLLSIYFIGYSYGIGAGHPVQYSFTVNYDLTLRKELKLSDIFKPDSKYLEFLAHYCTDELSKRPERVYLFKEALTPSAAGFESWNITRKGVTFNFDACKVSACAAGEQEVDIPFTTLEPWLNSQTHQLLVK